MKTPTDETSTLADRRGADTPVVKDRRVGVEDRRIESRTAPTGDAPTIKDRRTSVNDRRATPAGNNPLIDNRRVGVTDRRITPRMKTLKGGQIVWPTAAPVKCIVRNLSQTGANLEVHSPVPFSFELVFDGDQSRRSCYVIWRRETRIGVKFR